MKYTPPQGMQAFTLVWFGQVVSLVGSAMTWFAFTIWAWQKTGQATALSTISFFAFLPTVLFTPLAGALVDRWNRKLVMMLSDFATALGTLTVLLLYSSGALQVWHLYLVSILAGFFTAFQYPAYNASVPCCPARSRSTKRHAGTHRADLLTVLWRPPRASHCRQPKTIRRRLAIGRPD